MNPAETRYHAGEQELFAVVKALEHFRPYVEGAVHLTVITDHRPNVTLDSRPHSQLSGRQVRWLQFLSRFCIQWEWRKGISNIADPLSRIPCLNSFTASQMQTPSDQLLDEIQEPYVHDPYFKDSRKTRQLSFDGSYWRRKTSIAVPNYSGLREQCIRLHHDLPYSGHLGRDRTLDLISRYYWWPGIYTDVSHYFDHCDQCQRNKVPAQKLPGLLQPLEIPGHKWESVSTDLITQLPETTKGHTAIVCFVDRLTKMVHLAATVTTINSKEFAHLFMKEVFAKHGLPRSIVSDRDTRFTSEFFRDVCRYLQIEQSMSTAFHPQSDGQTECTNRFVEDILRAYVSPAQDDWDVYLPLVEFAINNAYQESVQNSPFFLNYGYHPRTPADIAVSSLRGGPLNSTFGQDVSKALEHAKECLSQAQFRMSKYANRKRREVQFQIGDFVLLSAKNLHLKFDGVKKLMNRYFGLFEIAKKIGNVAYELKLPNSMAIHDVFHVSLLKIYKRSGANIVPPPALLPSGGIEFEVEQILDHSDYNNSRDYLIQWKDDPQPTWHDAADLSNCKLLVEEYCKARSLPLIKPHSAKVKGKQGGNAQRNARPRRAKKRAITGQ